MPDRKKRGDELIAYFAKSPIKKTLGMVLSFNEDGESQMDLPHHPGLEHGMGDTHGGIIATLLGTVGWFAAAVQYDKWIATIEMQMRLLEPAGREPLRATSKVLRAGKSFAMTEMEVRSAAGRLIATGSGTYAVTGPLGKKENDLRLVPIRKWAVRPPFVIPVE